MAWFCMNVHDETGDVMLTTIEQSIKMPPTILQPKDGQQIQDTGKIQDANDLVIKEDTRDIAKEDTLLLTKKVRWKDMRNDKKQKSIRMISKTR